MSFLDEFGLAHVWQNIKNYIDSKIDSDSGNAQEVYSTEETRIGTWIDGKPLYRKVFIHDLSNSTSTWELVAPVIENANVYRIYGNCVSVKGLLEPLPVVHPFENPSTNVSVYYSYLNPMTGLGIFVCHSTENYNNARCFIILEYTKTTD